jgi:hypothetical protein
MSRGLTTGAAQALLTRSFAGELLDPIRINALRSEMIRIILAKLKTHSYDGTYSELS